MKIYFVLFSLFGLCSFSISKISKFKVTQLQLISSCIYCIASISIGLTTYLHVNQFHQNAVHYKSDVNRKNDLAYITYFHLSYYATLILSILNVKQHVSFLNHLYTLDKQISQLIDKNCFKNIKLNQKLCATIIAIILYRISVDFLRNYLPIICRIWIMCPLFTEGLIMFYLTYLATIQLNQNLCVNQYLKFYLHNALPINSKRFKQIFQIINNCEENFYKFNKSFNWYFLVVKFNNFAILLDATFSLLIAYRYEISFVNLLWFMLVLVKTPFIISFLDLVNILDKLGFQVETRLFIIATKIKTPCATE